MSRLRQAGLFAGVAFLAAAMGFLVYSAGRSTHPQVPAAPPTATASDGGSAALMTAVLPDLAGQPQALSQWRGKILVVNFWATWCAPCREEIPALIQVQEELGANGVQVVGIAIDQADRVKPYAAEMRIGYPLLVGELEAIDLSRKAGNDAGGLPFTVVLDRTGKVAQAVSGRLTLERLRALLQALL